MPHSLSRIVLTLLITVFAHYNLAEDGAPVSPPQAEEATTNNTPAAEPAPPPKPALIIEADTLLASIEKTRNEVDILSDQVRKAQGEDRDALGRRVTKRILNLLEELDTLSVTIAAMEKESLDSSSYRAVAEPLLHRAAKNIQVNIDAIEADLDNRKKIKARFPLNISLDTLYESLSDQINALERLGIATEKEQHYLKTHLVTRAERLSGRIEIAKEEENKLTEQLHGEPDNAEYQKALSQEQEQMDRLTNSLSGTIKIMQSFELDTSSYQRLLLKSTGDITADILDKGVIGGLFTDWLKQLIQSARENGATFFLKICIFVFVILVFKLLSKITGRIVEKSVRRSSFDMSKLLQEMIISSASRTVMIIGVLMALSQIGVTLGPLLAGLGVAGFIVGFALQDSLSNFASGMMILIYRPYDNGDFIEAAGIFGVVESMNLVSTTILTIDNQTLIVPNNKIWGDVIKNITHQQQRRVDLVFSIGYQDSIPRAEEVLADIVEKHEKILSEPEPIIKLHTLNESSLDFVVRPWVKTEDYWDVYWDLTREVKMRFDQEGISIPFPQRDVHIYREELPPA